MSEALTTRVFIILLLFFGVISISLGLSFFKTSLNSATSLQQALSYQNFNVDFSSAAESATEIVATGDVIPERNVEGFSANPATIDNTEDPTLKNISVTFNEPGEAVSYSLYAANVGDTPAYLKSITISNFKDETVSMKCVPLNTTTTDLVEAACKDITVELEIGSSGIQRGSISGIKNHILNPKKTEKMNVIITYRANAQRTDGPFLFNLGDIKLLYSPVD